MKKLPIIEFDIFHSPHDIENAPMKFFGSAYIDSAGEFDEIPDKYKEGFLPSHYSSNVKAKEALIRRIFHEEFIKEKKDKYMFENISPVILDRIAYDVRKIWEEKIKVFYVFKDDELNIVGF